MSEILHSQQHGIALYSPFDGKTQIDYSMGDKKLQTTFRTMRYGACTFSLILDKRHPKVKKDTFPVAMRYTIDRKSWYHCKRIGIHVLPQKN